MIKRNAAICGLCDQTIESTHRHDFVSCKCGHLFVDGGHDYQRFGYNTENENGRSMIWNNKTEEWDYLVIKEDGKIQEDEPTPRIKVML